MEGLMRCVASQPVLETARHDKGVRLSVRCNEWMMIVTLGRPGILALRSELNAWLDDHPDA